MRYPPALLDEIRARLPVSQVVARKVKLKRQGREYAGLSPFKTEKTASFFVNDHKGFYHCFASGEHGDIFTFLMKTEGLAFPEAVERLAAEAGVTLPKGVAPSPQDQDRRQRLYLLLEEATAYFEAQLLAPDGREALRYLEGRGLSRDTITRFRLGFAPAGRAALKQHLAAAGFTQEELIESGMVVHGPDIPVSYDRFRNRVTFPITDAKERVIAFGARALEKDAKPKYLNSPETALFHKGHQLFNAAKARSAAHDSRRLIVVEGYMDTIALHQAGFAEAVAPLGTALTPDQLQLLWRMCPEPTLCFDGDDAGRRAAFRAVETALPHLAPGRSLSFAFLPDGLDPDDLIRADGPSAMEEVLGRAKPFAHVLWEREWSAGQWTTPERRAQLQQRLREKVASIADPVVREYYGQELFARLADALGQAASSSQSESGPRRGRSQRPQAAWSDHGGASSGHRPRTGFAAGRAGAKFAPGIPPGPSASLKRSKMVAASSGVISSREALLLRTLVNHPWLVDDWAEVIAALPISDKGLSRLRDAILEAHAVSSPLDRGELRDQLVGLGYGRALEILAKSASHKGDRFAEPGAAAPSVEAGWRHVCALHGLQVDLKQGPDAAERAWRENQYDEAMARIAELDRIRNAGEGREAAVEGYGTDKS